MWRETNEGSIRRLSLPLSNPVLTRFNVALFTIPVGRTGLEPDPLRVLSSHGVQRRSPAFNSSSFWEISSADVWHHSSQFKIFASGIVDRSEEHTSELQSLRHLVCRL